MLCKVCTKPAAGAIGPGWVCLGAGVFPCPQVPQPPPPALPAPPVTVVQLDDLPAIGGPVKTKRRRKAPTATSWWQALLMGQTSWTVGSTGPLKFAPQVTGHAGDDWGPDGQQLQACPACGHDLTL